MILSTPTFGVSDSPTYESANTYGTLAMESVAT